MEETNNNFYPCKHCEGSGTCKAGKDGSSCAACVKLSNIEDFYLLLGYTWKSQMSFHVHTPVKDTDNKNMVFVEIIKNHMLSVLDAAHDRVNVRTLTAYPRVAGNHVKGVLQS